MAVKKVAQMHESAVQRHPHEAAAAPELAGPPLNVQAAFSAGSSPPLNPGQVAFLQRMAGNRALSRLLLEKPTPAPIPEAIAAPAPAAPPVQRHIIGTADPHIWANDIAGRVYKEQDEQIKQAVTRLHSITQPVFVKDYTQLVANIRNGSYDQLLEASRKESPQEAKYNAPNHPTTAPVAALIGALSNNFAAALGSHPLVNRVWLRTWPNQDQTAAEWNLQGVREVLTMFLYFHTNADTIHGFFARNQQLRTEAIINQLNNVFVAHLGAGLGGKQELDGLVKGTLQFNIWLKEGLDAAETMLGTHQQNFAQVNAYVTFNLDNETKQYFRKLLVAKDPPGGAQRNQAQPDVQDLRMRLVLAIKSKELYLPLVNQYIKDVEGERNLQMFQLVIDDIKDLVEVEAPSAEAIQQFLAVAPEPAHDVRETFPRVMQHYTLPNSNDALKPGQVAGWLKEIDKAINVVVLQKKGTTELYTIVGKKGMDLYLKKQ